MSYEHLQQEMFNDRILALGAHASDRIDMHKYAVDFGDWLEHKITMCANVVQNLAIGAGITQQEVRKLGRLVAEGVGKGIKNEG